MKLKKGNLSDLGYNFIPNEYIPEGKDEYFLRNKEHLRDLSKYRGLSAYEIEVLVKNANASNDWGQIFVTEDFNPKLVKRCQFHGLIRIGALENCYLEYHDIRIPVGLYDSTIVSCDLGDNVVINNVNYLSHYQIGDEAILINLNEVTTTNKSKFGNGILKKDEDPSIRIQIELCNENGGRSVLPFEDMQAGDAYIWSKYRNDKELMNAFTSMVDRQYDTQRGHYGQIKKQAILKNCLIIKDVNIGEAAYLKGCNKLKNLTIRSSPTQVTQIGEGVELVNGIIGYGCRLFYGVKAVRFVMSNNSSLKYGARLINSFLGENSTISCCEVLNSLIFPSHEQHHNNSFLCAATLLGQTNIAAGATIGSNHNSRSNDGEITAGRGFWPGLCVSLKHNSKFASFNLITKGDYPTEINQPIPFSLISNDESKNELIVMPGYWFFYNMYALARNSWKYENRDKRKDKSLYIEFDYLAPDSIEEMFKALNLFELWTGLAIHKNAKNISTAQLKKDGKELLLASPEIVDKMDIFAPNVEASRRNTRMLKVGRAYHMFSDLINYYGVKTLLKETADNHILNSKEITSWVNLGNQLVLETEIESLKENIKNNKIQNWKEVHNEYIVFSSRYKQNKLDHAINSLLKIHDITVSDLEKNWNEYTQKSIETFETLNNCVLTSRSKDYTDPFRKITFDNQEEMDAVIGKLEDNEFIKLSLDDLDEFKNSVNKLKNIKIKVTFEV